MQSIKNKFKNEKDILKLVAEISKGNLQDFYNSLLVHAVISGFDNLILNLIDQGANVNIDMIGNDSNIIQPLFHKILYDYDEEFSIKIIMSGKLDLDKHDNKYKMSYLMWSCDYELNDVAFKLIEFGVNLNLRNQEGDTALQFACDMEMKTIAIKLIESGAYVDGQGNENYTALMNTCDHKNMSENREAIAKKLIDYNANLQLTNIKNETIFDILYRRQHVNLINYINSIYKQNLYNCIIDIDTIICKIFNNPIADINIAEIICIYL